MASAHRLLMDAEGAVSASFLSQIRRHFVVSERAKTGPPIGDRFDAAIVIGGARFAEASVSRLRYGETGLIVAVRAADPIDDSWIFAMSPGVELIGPEVSHKEAVRRLIVCADPRIRRSSLLRSEVILASHRADLTPMETATLCAIIGDADDELVSRYGIGKETLRTHRQRVIDKVGCGSQLGLCVRVFSAALGLADSR